MGKKKKAVKKKTVKKKKATVKKKKAVTKKKAVKKKTVAKKKTTAKKKTASKTKISLRDLKKIRKLPRRKKAAVRKRKHKPQVLRSKIKTTATPAASGKKPSTPPAPQAYHEPFIDRGMTIPDTYNNDRIAALVRDPGCIYLYWEFTGCKRQQIS